MKKILVVKTGLHIGAADDAMKIGGVDSPVIKREVYCNEKGEVSLSGEKFLVEPYIPGSSLKGKIRSILEHFFGLHTAMLSEASKKEAEFLKLLQEKYQIETIEKFDNFEKKKDKDDDEKEKIEKIKKEVVYKNWNKIKKLLGEPINSKCLEYLDEEKKELAKVIIAMFGESAEKKEGEFGVGRVVFRDAFITEKIRKKAIEGFELTETKIENVIDRIKGSVKGGGVRNIERVVPGVEFDVEVVVRDYGFEIEDTIDINKLKNKEFKDLLTGESEKEVFEKVLEKGFKLLEENDYLGGSGSRGYGAVEFKD